MSLRIKFLIAAGFIAWFGRDGARAQEQQPLTAVNGNCRIYFTLTVQSSGAQATAYLPTDTAPPAGSVGTSQAIDNHQPGCYGWTVQYTASGFSALSLAFQVANDNAGGTAPDTWSSVAVCGTANCIGINPNTSTANAVTTTLQGGGWFRMNLLSKTGTGRVKGVLYGYKIDIAGGSGGGGSGNCPGGPNTSVQFRSGTACAGNANFTFNGSQVVIPNGTGPAPGIAFTGSIATGYYLEAPFVIATRDGTNRWAASGIATNTFMDNDSWRCGEGEEFGQHGACESFSFRVLNNARYWDFTDTFLTYGDPAGGGAGDRVGTGRFTTDGATAAKVHAAISDGGTHVTFEAKDFQSSGALFAALGTPANGYTSYCSNCTVTSSIDNTCAGGGTGAQAQRLNGVWKCSM